MIGFEEAALVGIVAWVGITALILLAGRILAQIIEYIGKRTER